MEKLTALVTGGSSGIGEEICRYLLQANATVVNLDIPSPQNAQSADYHVELADLCKPEATRGTAPGIVRKFPFMWRPKVGRHAVAAGEGVGPTTGESTISIRGMQNPIRLTLMIRR